MRKGDGITARQLLLIEDSVTDARLVRAALAGLRDPACDVEHVPDLASAVARLSGPAVDLVLLDLHLPESQGLETLHRVQALVPGLPVVVVTGLDDERIAEHAIRAGAQELVLKGTPHFVSVLRHAIRGALERVQVLEAMRAAAAPPAPQAEGIPVARLR